MSEAFGTEVKTRRVALGMSQARLAELVGRSTSTVRSWERGKTEPSPDALDALTAVLDINSHDDETAMGMPAVVSGVASESFEEIDTAHDEKSCAQEEDISSSQEQTDGGVELASATATGDSFSSAEGVRVDVTVVQNPTSIAAPVLSGTNATVSFVDEPTGTMRYIVRIVATVGTLLGLAIVGRWAASGALEIAKDVLSAIKAGFGF